MAVIDPTLGVELLVDVGLRRQVVDANTVEIEFKDGAWSKYRVMPLGHTPSPSEISRDLEKVESAAGLYYVVGRAGAALTRAASDDVRVAYGALDEGAVSVCGELHTVPTNSSDSPYPTGRGRVPWARFGVIRLLALSSNPLNQVEISRRLGVTQAAVSQAMAHLGQQVERAPGGWAAVDRAALWDKFMAEYPGPGGLATYWLGIDEPAHQLKRARQAFHSQAAHPQTTDGSPPPLLSADLACDYYAPWRKPTKIVLYGTTIHSLRDSGFAEVRSAEASLELRVCKDPTISAMAGHWETSGIDHASAFVENELVDPLLAAWDMKRTLGTDVPEALEKVRSRALRMAKWY